MNPTDTADCVIAWLLDGDVAIQYQVYRDLLGQERPDLRALDYFRDAGVAYDPRMQDALDVLRAKRRNDGTWPLQARHPGQIHFDMETPGQASRWNTLRALRVLRRFEAAES